MKRFGAVCLALILCLSGFTACGDTGTDEHNWSAWEVTTPATCTSEGVETRRCLDEGCTETETRPIDKIPHDWSNWNTDQEPTTTSSGSMSRECSVCHTEETQTLPALTSSGGYTITTKRAGNCTEEAIFTYTYGEDGPSFDVTGDKDPANHLGTAYACGAHCHFCSPSTQESDHVAASCGVEGHYICDSADHFACTIEAADNMAFSLIDNETAYRLDKFTAAGTSESVLVPSYYNGKPVTEIADEVFYGLEDGYDAQILEWIDGVTYVYIPDTVEKIGVYFAYNMDALAEIRLPKSVEFGGTSSDPRNHAFFDSPALTALNIPRGTTGFTGNIGFGGEAESALKILTIPSSFTDLSCLTNYLTVGNVSLDALRYEGSAEDWNALVGALAEGELKTLLTELGTAEKITYDYSYETLYAEEGETLRKKASGFLFVEENGGFTLLAYVGDPVETLIIPNEVSGIPVKKIEASVLDATDGKNNANALNTVKYVQIGPNLEEIGAFNFYGMDELLSVEIPATVKQIGRQSFYDCAKLQTVDIADGVIVDMSNAPFAYLPALQSITLPASLRNLSETTGFVENAADYAVDFGGTENLWKLLAGENGNLASLDVAFNHGASIVTDETNGLQYAENADGTLTLVNITKAGTGTSFTIAESYDGKDITSIGGAVFNANAYDGEIKTWLENLTELLLEDGKITTIGDYNFVGLLKVSTLWTPATLNQTKMIGCFSDLNGITYLRVPRGIVQLYDCFQWSGTWFPGANWGGLPNYWLILPMSVESFSGNSWTGTVKVGFVLFDTDATGMGGLPAKWESMLSDGTMNPAVVAFMKTMSPASLLCNTDTWSYDRYGQQKAA